MVAAWSAAHVATLCASILTFGSHAAAPSGPPETHAAPDGTAVSEPAPSVNAPPPPPPGYQQPPAAHDQVRPPSTVQPASLPAPRSVTGTRRFLSLLYVGVAEHAETLPPGELPFGDAFMIGTLLGRRLSPTFSLNCELRFEISERQADPESFGGGPSVAEFEAAFSPLFHRPNSKGELVIGPKLGVYGALEGNRSAFGISLGGNAGLFFRATPTMSLGGLFSYTIRDNIGCSGYCGSIDIANDHPTEHVIALHLGALF